MGNVNNMPFLWGSATASYQCEGAWNEEGKGLGEWDFFSHTSNKNINHVDGDVSCDDRVGNVGVSAPTADRQTQAAPVLESGIAT